VALPFNLDAMQKPEELGESFRQSKREFWVMVGIWTFFAIWTVSYNGFFADGGSESDPEILFGMPRWVVIGVVVPWILAVSATIWFAMAFMKDTPLGDEEETE